MKKSDFFSAAPIHKAKTQTVYAHKLLVQFAVTLKSTATHSSHPMFTSLYPQPAQVKNCTALTLLHLFYRFSYQLEIYIYSIHIKVIINYCGCNCGHHSRWISIFITFLKLKKKNNKKKNIRHKAPSHLSLLLVSIQELSHVR